MVPLGSLQLHQVVGILFDGLVPRQRVTSEAVQIPEAPCLRLIETAFRVRDESALPLALPGQIILGGRSLSATDLAARRGAPPLGPSPVRREASLGAREQVITRLRPAILRLPLFP